MLGFSEAGFLLWMSSKNVEHLRCPCSDFGPTNAIKHTNNSFVPFTSLCRSGKPRLGLRPPIQNSAQKTYNDIVLQKSQSNNVPLGTSYG